MSTEALVLALTGVIRPTSAAAVFAMLSTPRPQRLLVAYLVVGLGFSLAVGTLVVVLLGGLQSTRASSAVRPLLDLVLGTSALGCAASAWIGWLPRSRPRGSGEPDSWLRRRLTDMSPSGAAVAGVLTHLPGLVYLAALNAIAAGASGTASGVLQVVVYNGIWFSLAIVALVLSVYRPTVSREFLERVISWIREHQRVITIGFFGALGGYLVVVGVLGLVGDAS
ncbi:Sap-like sulfolipid-1-addressing protein [Pseudonocardia hierapolitana]|uniref:Sap-like sulfolipid-1-addressing protein n=1 Tax=Pseudonocardia hierapolitana TaxID=1128676 RepID=A0A561SJH9_9PSEU|nr:GAP family protein [Pseudonocardia hierapolitana]TWF75037.1 Sap-like sulfolipid-1-addressing protein [Pseudonocardia hierapolitana]